MRQCWEHSAKSFANLVFLPEFLLALARTTLLKFQAILLSRDRLYKVLPDAAAPWIFLGLSAIHAPALELLQRLIAGKDRALLQDGFVVRHAALVYSQLLVHFEELCCTCCRRRATSCAR